MSHKQSSGIADLDVLAGADVAQSDKVRLLDVSAGEEKSATVASLAAPVVASIIADSGALGDLGDALPGGGLADAAAVTAAYVGSPSDAEGLAQAMGAMRLLNVGTVTVAELFANGPKTLYTPAEDEMVLAFFRSGVAIGDLNWDMEIEPLAQGGPPYWTQSDNTSNSLSDGSLLTPERLFPNAPVRAMMLNVNGGGPELTTGLGAWQANHAYTVGEGVLDGNGHAQMVTTAGTSDNSEPTWDTGGSTTADGTATWIDLGVPPSTGSAKIMLLVAKAIDYVAP